QRSRFSSNSLPSASCCESYAILDEVPGRIGFALPGPLRRLAVEHVLAVEQRAWPTPLTAKPALSEFSTAQIKPRSLAFPSSERNKLDREPHGPAGELSRQRQR